MSNDPKNAKLPKEKFFKIRCPSCGNDQIVYRNATTAVRCLACNTELAKTGAGRITPKAAEFTPLGGR